MFDYASREPLGVAVLITAWNSPMGLLSNKLAPALAAGNCVVVKPSEHASATTLEFCRLIERAGFPAGVFNVVTGDRPGQANGLSRQRDRPDQLYRQPESAGRSPPSAARNLVPVTLELGGKSPNMIFADADLDKAVVGALAGIFAATGQTCIAGSRLLVQRPVTMKSSIGWSRGPAIVMGDPTDHATEMGTAANEPQFHRVLKCIDDAKAKARFWLAAGGLRRGGL